MENGVLKSSYDSRGELSEIRRKSNETDFVRTKLKTSNFDDTLDIEGAEINISDGLLTLETHCKSRNDTGVVKINVPNIGTY